MEFIDLRKLHWESNEVNTTGIGAYLKARDMSCSPIIYYKLSKFDNYSCQIIGYESFFEVVASRLGELLGLPVLHYDLIDALIRIDTKYRENAVELRSFLCRSVEFGRGDESKSSLGAWYKWHFRSNFNVEANLRKVSLYISDYIDKLFIFDYLICNRDRHEANIEVLIKKDGKLRLSPFFDNGASFVAPFGMDRRAIESFDVIFDRPVHNFIGASKLEENLHHICKPVMIKRLDKNFKEILFKDMDMLPDYVKKAIVRTITYRYTFLVKNGFVKIYR